MNKKALIAMSGGVDSSVAALIMKNKGYDCIGITMQLFHNEDINIPSEKTCCSLTDTNDARNIAYKLSIPFYVFNFTDSFKSEVIDRFVSSYEKGETPNPCIYCNRYMKFDKLYQRALLLGYDYVVTGHYARIKKESGRFLLKKAVDVSKDQSYVLYFMTQEQLAHTQFPLGDMSKAETRKTAEEYGFINAKKHESQDICFVPNGNYAKFIENCTRRKYNSGNFVDHSKNILGRHKGIIYYTIGQRKGLGLLLNEPMYVCEKRISDNTVVLGKNKDLFSKELDALNFNWIAFENPSEKMRVKAKIRYRQREEWATVEPIGESTVHIAFEHPQRAITKGQAVVLYDGDIVVGGGTIC